MTEKKEKMILRTYKKEDADLICGWIRSEEELYKWSADIFSKYPFLAEDLDEHYSEKLKKGRFVPLVATDEKDTVLGHFIIRYPREDDDTTVRIGFVILDPKRRGQGYGRQMISLATEYAKTSLHAHRAELGVFANNPPAKRCYESAGFREYGRRMCEMPIGTWECIDLFVNLD